MNKNENSEKGIFDLLQENRGKMSYIYNELEYLCKNMYNYTSDNMNNDVMSIKTIKDEIYLQSFILDDILNLIQYIKKEFGI